MALELTDAAWRVLVGRIPRRVTRWRYATDHEPDRKEPPVVRWRQAILGPDGPPPTTRLVLLALGTHMNETGGSCFPSIDLLVQETGLSKRAVLNHVGFAEAECWIEITQGMGYGKGWKRNEYQATVPLFGGEGRSPRRGHRNRRGRPTADVGGTVRA